MPITKVQIVDGAGNPSGGGSTTPSFVQLSNGSVALKDSVATKQSSASGFLDVLALGRYNASPPALADGDVQLLQLESAGNLRTAEQFAPVAEDNVVGVIRVEHRFSYQNITTGATTTVKSGAGLLRGIVINTPVASATITIYDNTTNSGTKIGTITLGGTLANDMETFYPYDVLFSTGLTLVTSTTTDITVVYR